LILFLFLYQGQNFYKASMTRALRAKPDFSLALPSTPVVPLKQGELSLPAPSEVSDSAGCVVDVKRGVEFNASEIVPLLFLGTASDAADATALRRHRIRRVLNVARECPVIPDCAREFQVRHIPLDDHSDAPIGDYLDDACEFIREGLRRGEGVLVHCRMGVSRSASFVIAFIMKYGGSLISPVTGISKKMTGAFMPTGEDSSPTLREAHVPYSKAFEWVKQRRQEISPNIGFCIALREFNAKLGFSDDTSVM
jgi:hypothetical protein